MDNKTGSEDITKGTTKRWHSLGVQPACEQSGHAYTATLDISMPQEGSGGLGLRPSLVVGDALPFSSLPTDNGSGSVSSLHAQRCSWHRSR